MKDRYGRTINYMRVSVTDRCNLRCRYCMPEGITPVPMEEILTYEEIVQVCSAAARAGISRIKVTGGEPLVRAGCAEFIGMLKKIPGICQVTMTTNGVLLHQYLPQLLENGLDAVNISLDTLRPEVYESITGKRELAQVLENIELAVQAGLRVKINCVLVEGVNEGEWKELAALTEKLQADVRFIEMMPIGYGKDFAPIYQEELLQRLSEVYPDLEKDESIHGNGPAVYYRRKGAKGSIGFISAVHGKFCSSCNRLRLTSQGKLKPCLCYADGIDVRRILRRKANQTLEKVDQTLEKVDQTLEKAGLPDPAVSESLYQVFLQAVDGKPKMHQFEVPDGVTEKEQMAQIGG